MQSGGGRGVETTSVVAGVFRRWFFAHAGKRGVAHSFITTQDRKLAPELAALLRASGCCVPDALAAAFDLTLRRPGAGCCVGGCRGWVLFSNVDCE
jgi:hypothetical protein